MKVLINAVSARIGGGVTVLRNLLSHFPLEDDGTFKYEVFVRRETWGAVDPGHPRVAPYFYRGPSESQATRLVAEQVQLPLRAIAGRQAVLFSMANLGVLASPVPQVLMYQNSAPFEPAVLRCYSPEERGRVKTLRRLSIMSARRVDTFVYLSNYSARLIDPLVNLKHKPTRIVSLGRDPHFYTRPANETARSLNTLGINSPFVLAVSQLYRYKGLIELTKAYAKSSASSSHKLVIAGADCDRGYRNDVISVARAAGVEDSVVLTGSVSREDLPNLYSACDLFLFPSICESFPNILIEALACGAVCALSDRGPMKEIAGEDGFYFDTYSEDSIVEAINNGLTLTREKRLEINERSRQRAETYTWGNTAKGLLQAFDTAL